MKHFAKLSTLLLATAIVGCGGGDKDEAAVVPDLTAPVAEEANTAIDKWIAEFQPSALSEEEQRAELEWFAKAAAPYAEAGIEIKSAAEGIRTHTYESEVLAKAFYEITGIKIVHDIIGEGEIVDRVQRQIQTKRKLYDIYVNDADMIGTHLRLDSALNLSEYMIGEGANATNPTLDLDDFLNLGDMKKGI